jgi:hypothetical protein
LSAGTWRTVWQAVSKNRTQLKAVQVSDRQNEKTRQKAGFSGVPEILKAFSGTLYGAAPRVESNHNILKIKGFINKLGCFYL